MKKYLLLASALVLVGAGCSQSASNLFGSNSNSQTNTNNQNANGFNLTATALGNEQIKVAFTVSDADAKDAEGYRILMGHSANPDMKTASDWYTLGKDHREKIWSNRPIGTRHFRVCIMKKNTCIAYSNDVEVDIK